MVEKPGLDSYYQKIGELIKEKRNKAKKSQEQLSKHLGFESRISIANIESGKQKIHVHTLAYIAQYLKVSIAELLPIIETKADIAINPQLAKSLNKEGLSQQATKAMKEVLHNLPSIKSPQ
jgi:transcriptional regulator with XRE-family HTH domain